MAPERFRGVTDPRGDIFSLGLTLYELFTLRPAFDETDRATLIQKLTRESPLSPRLVDPSIPRDLETILLKATARDSGDRYQSMRDLAEDLRRFLEDRPIVARRTRVVELAWRWCQRNPAQAALTASICGLVLGMLFVLGAMYQLRGDREFEHRARRRAEKAESETQQALDLVRKAEREVTIRRHISEAAALRHRGQVGQRFESLAQVQRALEMAPPAEFVEKLRSEAIAALALPDLSVEHEWEIESATLSGIDFDAEFDRYVRLNTDGSAAFCRREVQKELRLSNFEIEGQGPFHGPWVSPDGKTVVIGTDGKVSNSALALEVWDLSNPVPRKLWRAALSASVATAMSFRADARQFAVGLANNSVAVFEIETGRQVWTETLPSIVHYAAFHPRDARLAVSVGDLVRIINVDQGQEVRRLNLPENSVGSVSWHPDGRRLAAARGLKIFLFDTETGSRLGNPWEGHRSVGIHLAFHPQGDLLVSSDWQGDTRLWDVPTATQVLRWPQSTGCRFGTTNHLLGAGHSGSRWRLFQVARGTELRTIRPADCPPLGLLTPPILSHDGHILATSFANTLCLFDVDHGRELGAWKVASAKSAIPQGYHKDRGWLIAFEQPGAISQLEFWPMLKDPGVPERLTLTRGSAVARSIGGSGALSADGQVLAVANLNAGAEVVRLADASATVRLGSQYDVRQAAISPDGRWIVTCSHWPDPNRNHVQVWDGRDGTLAQKLPIGNQSSAVFSPNSLLLATHTPSEGTRLWNVGDWRLVSEFPSAGRAVFNPDATLLAMGDIPGTIQLLEVPSGRILARLSAPAPLWIWPVCFAADGSRLVAMDTDLSQIYIWNLRELRRNLARLALDWESAPLSESEEPERKLEAVLAADPKMQEFEADELAAQGGAALDALDYRKAQEYFQKAIELDSGHGLACNGLSWLMSTGPSRFRDSQQAVTLARRAVERHPEIAIYRNTLGVALYRAGLFAEAIQDLERSLSMAAGQSDAFDLYFLAMAHFRLKNPETARELLERAERWFDQNRANLPAGWLAELQDFQAEARAIVAP
jgi:WD40 repeat protein